MRWDDDMVDCETDILLNWSNLTSLNKSDKLIDDFWDDGWWLLEDDKR